MLIRKSGVDRLPDRDRGLPLLGLGLRWTGKVLQGPVNGGDQVREINRSDGVLGHVGRDNLGRQGREVKSSSVLVMRFPQVIPVVRCSLARAESTRRQAGVLRD